jgi:hypothetical protein
MTVEVVSDDVELLEHVTADDEETSDFAEGKLLRTGRSGSRIPSFTAPKHNKNNIENLLMPTHL